jgi:hypothetical protein
MRNYTLEYLFNGEPRTYIFEFKQSQLPVHEAAIHLSVNGCLQGSFSEASKGPPCCC